MADDIGQVVSNWFTANPTASTGDVATAVQNNGGMTPQLASAIAQHYGTDVGTVQNTYTQLTAPQTPTVAPTPVTTTPVAQPTYAPYYTTPAQVLNGLQNGALNTNTVGNALQQVNQSSMPFTSASQVLTGLQSGVLNNSNVGDALGQVARVGLSPSNSSTLGSNPLSLESMAMNQGITNAQGAVPTPYSSATAPATANDTNPFFNTTYNALQYGNTRISSVEDQNQESGTQRLALTDSKGNVLPPDNVVPIGNGIYDLQIGSGASGGRDHIYVRVDPNTGFVMPVEDYNQQIGYQGGQKGGFFNQAAAGFSSLPGVNMAVAIAAPEFYPYLQAANALNSYNNGNIIGALQSGFGAYTGLTGNNPLLDNKAISQVNTSGLSTDTIKNINTGFSVGNAIASKNPIALATSVSKALGIDADPMVANFLTGVGFVRSLARGDTTGMMNAAISLVKSSNPIIANQAQKVIDANSNGGDVAQASIDMNNYVDKATKYYDYAISQGKNPTEASLFVNDALSGGGGGSMQTVAFTPENIQSLQNLINQNPSDTDYQKRFNQIVQNEIASPNTTLRPIGDGAYLDTNGTSVWVKDSSGNWRGVDATIKDGNVSYENNGIKTTTGLPQSPSTIAYNFADLNPNQQASFARNIIADKTGESGGASGLRSDSFGILPFQVIGHTTTGNEVYQDNGGKSFTLMVVNGEPTQVPLDESKITWVKNDQPTPVSISPLKTTPSSDGKLTDSSSSFGKQTDSSITSSAPSSSTATSSSPLGGGSTNGGGQTGGGTDGSPLTSNQASTSNSELTKAQETVQQAQSALANAQTPSQVSQARQDLANAQIVLANAQANNSAQQNGQIAKINEVIASLTGGNNGSPTGGTNGPLGNNKNGNGLGNGNGLVNGPSNGLVNGPSSGPGNGNGLGSGNGTGTGTDGTGTGTDGTGVGTGGTSGGGTGKGGTDTHACPTGYHWDATSNSCVKDTTTDHACPTGYHWDSASNSCVKDTTTTVTPPTTSVLTPTKVTPTTLTQATTPSGGGSSKENFLPMVATMLGGAPMYNEKHALAQLRQLYDSLDPHLAKVLQQAGIIPPEPPKEEKTQTDEEKILASGKQSEPERAQSFLGLAEGGSALEEANAMFKKQFEKPSFMPLTPTSLSSAPIVQHESRFSPLKHLKQGIKKDAVVSPLLAQGGLPHKYKKALPEGHNPEFITGLTGYYADGRGTGQSDDIDAVLHEGDYVMDADTVASFGDGSSKAGAQVMDKFHHEVPHKMSVGGTPVPAKIADGEYVFPESFVTALGGGDNKLGSKLLDTMREELRSHKRSAPDTKIPPKAKSPLEYLKMAKG